MKLDDGRRHGRVPIQQTLSMARKHFRWACAVRFCRLTKDPRIVRLGVRNFQVQERSSRAWAKNKLPVARAFICYSFAEKDEKKVKMAGADYERL